LNNKRAKAQLVSFYINRTHLIQVGGEEVNEGNGLLVAPLGGQTSPWFH